MDKEIEFQKYMTRGAYHWDQISLHPTRSNASAKARYDYCISLLENEIGSFSNKKILDMGCGDGVLTWKICTKGAQGYGVDPSDIAIKFARAKHGEKATNAKFEVVSGYNTPFENNFFDAVISSDVIEHVQHPDLLLKEIDRLTKPGGVAIISTPIRITEFPLDKNHVVEWFPTEFQKVIESVFPDSKYAVSHPVFWMEMMERSKAHRIFVNVMSLVYNPFRNRGWKYYALQYAMIRKR